MVFRCQSGRVCPRGLTFDLIRAILASLVYTKYLLPNYLRLQKNSNKDFEFLPQISAFRQPRNQKRRRLNRLDVDVDVSIHHSPRRVPGNTPSDVLQRRTLERSRCRSMTKTVKTQRSNGTALSVIFPKYSTFDPCLFHDPFEILR